MPDSKKINMAPAKNPYKHSAVHLLVGDLCKHGSPQVWVLQPPRTAVELQLHVTVKLSDKLPLYWHRQYDQMLQENLHYVSYTECAPPPPLQ